MTDQQTPVEPTTETQTRVDNPFRDEPEQPAGQLAIQTHAPMASGTAVEASRAVAEIQAAMIMARQFPRNRVQAVDRLINEFSRLSLAEKAMYAYARGGTDITGPSIRSAETIAQVWGNIQSGVRELEQRRGVSVVEAFAWDLETGFRDVKVFEVPHVRVTKTRTYRLEDPRDIYELVANNGARRKRACILTVIPGDVVEIALEQASLTLRTKITINDELIQSLIDKFAAHGVSKQALETRIQRRIEKITPALVLNLGKIYNSIEDGMSLPQEWFEGIAATTTVEASATETLADKIAAKASEVATPSTDPVAVAANSATAVTTATTTPATLANVGPLVTGRKKCPICKVNPGFPHAAECPAPTDDEVTE